MESLGQAEASKPQAQSGQAAKAVSKTTISRKVTPQKRLGATVWGVVKIIGVALATLGTAHTVSALRAPSFEGGLGSFSPIVPFSPRGVSLEHASPSHLLSVNFTNPVTGKETRCIVPVSSEMIEGCEFPFSLPIDMPEAERETVKKAYLKGVKEWLDDKMQKKSDDPSAVEILKASKSLVADKEFRREITRFGNPDSAHPENEAIIHVGHVLTEISALIAADPKLERERESLELVALAHDSYKYAAREASAKAGKKIDHGEYAANAVRKHLSRISDPVVRERIEKVIQYHDMGFYAWQKYTKLPKSDKEGRALVLQDLRSKVEELHKLGGVDLYLNFLLADSASGAKEQSPLNWTLNWVNKMRSELDQQAQA